MIAMQKWIIIYDIRDAKRLRRTAKLMESFAERVQKSVFEMQGSEVSVAILRRQVKQVMTKDDSIIIFKMCPKCWQKKRQIGVKAGITNEDKPFVIL